LFLFVLFFPAYWKKLEPIKIVNDREKCVKYCWLVFAFLVGLFIFAIASGSLLPGSDFRSFVLPLGLLGLLLTVTAARNTLKPWPRFFFILTGAAASGWPVSLWVHNLLFRFWPDEPLIFMLVFYILPAAFFIGAAGTVVLGIKQKLCRHA
jgi:hypothetical protein